MKAAVVLIRRRPGLGRFYRPQPAPGQTLIDVRAAAISHVVKARASGRHYSFDGNLPFVPGIDGVGTTPQGQRVYFAFPTAPSAQRAPVALQNCLPLPDALDDIRAAAMANPGMSAWASLVTRAQLQAGETVLINGATGSAGQLAVQIARYLGRKNHCNRAQCALAALDADECIQLTADDKTLSRQFSAVSAAQIDVVIDYLWGHSAELLLPALAKYTPAGSPVRYVQVGFGWRRYRVKWRSAAFRSAPADGQRIGSLSVSQLLAATGEMLQAAVPGKLTIATTPRPLQEIAAARRRTTARSARFSPSDKNRFRTKDGVDILNEKYYLSHH